MSSRPLLDRAIFDDLVATIGQAGTRSVTELFVAESAAYVAAITEGAARTDDAAGRERARRAAHALKSGAGQLGGAALAAAAAAVEQAAAGGSADLQAVVAGLTACAEETTAAFRDALAGLSGGSG